MPAAHDPEPGSTRSSASRRPTSSAPQRYARAVQAGHLQRRRQRRLLHPGRRARPVPRRRHHQRRTCTSRRDWFRRQRHPELLALGREPVGDPAGRHRPLGGLAGRAVPADARPRRPRTWHRRLRLVQRRLHRRHQDRRPGRLRLAAAVAHPQQRSSAAGPARVWNMVFAGVPGRAGAAASRTRRTPRSARPRSVREKPFLYVDGAGDYRVFVPGAAHQLAGHHLGRRDAAPGTSLPLEPVLRRQARRHRRAPSTRRWPQGKNLLFTPGVYHLNQTHQVTRADTVVLGLGLRHAHPGQRRHRDDGRRRRRRQARRAALRRRHRPTRRRCWRSARPARRPSHAANPTSLHDVFFRIGGAGVGKATTSLRRQQRQRDRRPHCGCGAADHGSGVGWTINTADTGLVVNGDDVTDVRPVRRALPEVPGRSGTATAAGRTSSRTRCRTTRRTRRPG